MLLVSVSDCALPWSFFRRYGSSSADLSVSIPASKLERFLISFGVVGGCNKLEVFVAFVLQDLESFAPVRRGHCWDHMLVNPGIRGVYLRTRAMGVGVNVRNLLEQCA